MRKGELNMNQKKEEFKGCEVLTEVLGLDQNDEIHNESNNTIRKTILKDITEFERKIELGSRVKDIIEEGFLNINGFSRISLNFKSPSLSFQNYCCELQQELNGSPSTYFLI